MRATRAMATVVGLWGSVHSEAAAHAQLAAGPPTLTIEDAVNTALATNERAKKAPLRVEQSAGALERARAAFIPSVSANYTGVYDPNVDKSNRHFSATGGAGVNVNVFNPSSFPLYSQASHQLKSDRWGALEDIRALAFDTAHAYLQALSDEQVYQAAVEHLIRARADEDATSARAEAGLTSSNDVTRAKVATTSAVRDVVNTQATLTKAYLELGFLIGRPVPRPLVTPEATTRQAARGAWKREEVIKYAELHRPDLFSQTEKTAALFDSAREPLYRLAPTLVATGQLRSVVDPIAPERGLDETVSLTASWTIFDGGARYGDRRQRLAAARSSELDLELLRRSIALDIGIAVADLRAARAAFQNAEEGVTVASRNSEETSILYKQGLAKAIELTDANASAYDAKVQLATAKLAMEESYLELRAAMGLGPLGDELAAATAQAPTAPGGSPVLPPLPSLGTPKRGTP